jgi:hypothetical protein
MSDSDCVGERLSWATAVLPFESVAVTLKTKALFVDGSLLVTEDKDTSRSVADPAVRSWAELKP